MESHPCEKSRGVPPVGALPMPNSSLETPPAADDLDRCQHIDARGHRCRMFVAPAEKTFGSGSDSDLAELTSDLCAHHAQQISRRRRDGQTIAAELLASVSDFGDAASVNRFLGNLVKMVALRRIPRRDAVVMAYISQLILNSQAAHGRAELQSLQLELLQRKVDPPTRVVWDLPYRKNEADRARNSQAAKNSDAPADGVR